MPRRCSDAYKRSGNGVLNAVSEQSATEIKPEYKHAYCSRAVRGYRFFTHAYVGGRTRRGIGAHLYAHRADNTAATA